MKVIISGKPYEWAEDKLLVSEAIFIQKQTGVRAGHLRRELADGNAAAFKALVWLVQTRAGEQVAWDSLDFDFDELEVADEEPAEPATDSPTSAEAP